MDDLYFEARVPGETLVETQESPARDRTLLMRHITSSRR